MRRTPAASSAKAAPRRHSLPVVFPAARRRASHPCSRMRSLPTRPSLRRSHFGRDFEGELIATLVPDGLWWRSQGILGGVEGGHLRPIFLVLHFPPRPPLWGVLSVFPPDITDLEPRFERPGLSFTLVYRRVRTGGQAIRGRLAMTGRVSITTASRPARRAPS